jgi:hypothetical protein
MMHELRYAIRNIRSYFYKGKRRASGTAQG